MSKIINPFVFNDENVANSYGFFIMTDGIDLTRFNQNPVMLQDHWNYTDDVLGKWVDVKKENGKLMGIPEFDAVDADANKIAGKVDRGYIKACSMGIVFNKEDMVYTGENVILKNCELIEVSIVAIPSNKNSIQLFKSPGVPFDESEITNLTLSLTKNENLNLTIDMKKIILNLQCLMALGFLDAPKDGIDESELESKILGLSGKVKSLETQNQSLQTANDAMIAAQDAASLTHATELVNLAITQGKITADKKETFLELAKTNLALAKQTLESIPAKVNFGESISNTVETSDVKSPDDFEKLSDEAKLAFKTNSPDEYKKIFS